MEKLIRYLGLIDWLVAIGTLVVGLYLKNWWLIASGVLGLGIAWLQPAMYIKAKMEKLLVRKRKPGEVSTSLVQNDEAFYAEVLGGAESPVDAEETPPRPPRTYGSPVPPYAGTFIGRRKHNLLRMEHFNLFQDGADANSGATRY